MADAAIDWRTVLRQSSIFFVLVVMVLIGWILTPYFLTVENLINLTRQIALIGIVSLGMTFVILTAGIDLSVGATVSVAAVVTAQVITEGGSDLVSILAGLAVGLAIGAVNAVGIVLGRIPPFVMTLGSLTMGQGLALSLSGGRTVSIGERTQDFRWLGGGNVVGVPVPVIIFAVLAVLAVLLLRYSSFGRSVLAVGDNAEAARLSGIPVKRTVFLVYIIAGGLAALTGIVFVSRLGVGEPTAGVGLELQAIAVVVIGGASLFGGRGTIVGTVIGAAIVTILANVLDLLAVSPFTQQIVTGALVVLAVLFERLQHRNEAD